MQQPTQTIAILQSLREIGNKISIDDFGTGYSSLAYLHKMPLDILKVDRSFVNGMFESEKHLAIVRTIIGLASSLQLQVIAEGVETVEQLQKLQSLGCDMIQGYYLSKPIPAADAIKLLERDWQWPK
jgi:EAL domain-containing protein (putative c-di-GMP-specific phosphodiesterase class I)